jgi:hypothetical protein
MNDRVQWFPEGTGVWLGRVGGHPAYVVLELEKTDPKDWGAYVRRYDTRDGFRMTNISRAMDIAEMQETMDPMLLHRHKLLLPC